MNYRHLALIGLGVIATTATLLVSVACGDDSSSGGGGTALDPAKGDALAHAILPTDKDLPGKGWTVTKTDQFDDSTPSANTAACKDIDSRKAAAKAKSDPKSAGKAEKEYSRDGAGPLPTTVEFSVEVFKDSATPADTLKAFQDAVKSSNFNTCLKDTIAGSIGDTAGLKFDMKSATPLASAPNGGIAAAYDFTITAQGQTVNLRYETYVWQESNSGTTVNIGGDKADVNAALVKTALDKTVANLKNPPK